MKKMEKKANKTDLNEYMETLVKVVLPRAIMDRIMVAMCVAIKEKTIIDVFKTITIFEKKIKDTDLYTTRGKKSRDDLIRHLKKDIEDAFGDNND